MAADDRRRFGDRFCHTAHAYQEGQRPGLTICYQSERPVLRQWKVGFVRSAYVSGLFT